MFIELKWHFPIICHYKLFDSQPWTVVFFRFTPHPVVQAEDVEVEDLVCADVRCRNSLGRFLEVSIAPSCRFV